MNVVFTSFRFVRERRAFSQSETAVIVCYVARRVTWYLRPADVVRQTANSAGAKQKLRWLSRLSHSVKQLFLSANLGRSGKTYIAIGFVRERKAS